MKQTYEKLGMSEPPMPRKGHIDPKGKPGLEDRPESKQTNHSVEMCKDDHASSVKGGMAGMEQSIERARTGKGSL